MEQLNLLMRKTFATATPNEVCFIHVPKERVDKRIFNARFGYDRDIEDDGVTYSFNKSKLQQLAMSASNTVCRLSRAVRAVSRGIVVLGFIWFGMLK
jgi:hypothetical protein